MKKVPFSNDGFQALQQELYLLTDAQLKPVTDKVAGDFSGWMSENFELSSSQVGFIGSLNPKMLALLALQTSFFIGNRLPIRLTKPQNQINTLMRGSKLIRPDAKFEASSAGAEGFEVDGVLEIEITY